MQPAAAGVVKRSWLAVAGGVAAFGGTSATVAGGKGRTTSFVAVFAVADVAAVDASASLQTTSRAPQDTLKGLAFPRA